LGGGASATVSGIEFSQAALQMPKRPLQVSLVDADGKAPKGEALALTDAHGVTHQLNIAGGPATIEEFKPGLARGVQTQRRP
jgi:hypothetical protein